MKITHDPASVRQIPVQLRYFVDAYRSALDYDPVHEGGPDDDKQSDLQTTFYAQCDALARIGPIRNLIGLSVRRAAGVSVVAARHAGLLRAAFDSLGVGTGSGVGACDRVQLLFLNPILNHFGVLDDDDLPSLRRACDAIGVEPEPSLRMAYVPAPPPSRSWSDTFRDGLCRDAGLTRPERLELRRILFGVLAGIHACLVEFGVSPTWRELGRLQQNHRKSKGIVERSFAWRGDSYV
jgi:hypothetical protein